MTSVSNRERAAFGEVTIDGEKDAVYEQSTVGTVTSANTYGGATLLPKEEMTSASYSFAHDKDFLYYFVEVTDCHVTTAGADCIEIYYNFLKGSTNPKKYTSATKADGEAGYFTVYPNGSQPGYSSDKVSSDTAALLKDYAVKMTDSGYIVEGKIPLSTSVMAQLTGSEDIKVGMGFIIKDDSNDDGASDYYLVNTGEGDVLSAYGNPSMTLPLYLAPSTGSTIPQQRRLRHTRA